MQVTASTHFKFRAEGESLSHMSIPLIHHAPIQHESWTSARFLAHPFQMIRTRVTRDLIT